MSIVIQHKNSIEIITRAVIRAHDSSLELYMHPIVEMDKEFDMSDFDGIAFDMLTNITQIIKIKI